MKLLVKPTNLPYLMTSRLISAIRSVDMQHQKMYGFQRLDSGTRGVGCSRVGSSQTYDVLIHRSREF